MTPVFPFVDMNIEAEKIVRVVQGCTEIRGRGRLSSDLYAHWLHRRGKTAKLRFWETKVPTITQVS